MSGQVQGQIRGWCPGALRPMMSGDGLVLRIRPHAGRLLPEQVLALADLAETHGNGLIDLGSRAHLQLRGVTEAALPALHQALISLDLLDFSAEAEARRNILTTPLHRAGDETLTLVEGLEEALRDAPVLPAKFGFAVDTGAAAILGGASADLRIERAAQGLILRAEGMDRGEPVTQDTAIPRLIEVLHWFLAQGAATRMARLAARPPLNATELPMTGPALVPGRTAAGLCLALPFGQIGAAKLRALAVAPLRLTPWRSVIVEGITRAPVTGLIEDPHDPLLRVAACTGAPGCLSAEAPVRGLARSLAPLVPAGALLHVSGCGKGCAHPRPARLTLTARQGRFDLIEDGTASASPALRGLSPDDLPAILRGRLDPSL
ncbi:hypothetical protein [Paracoccus sp. IB05]|uniref:hypothetical protein n=1 Tax=Paracoccus sp. IB05 TaxID=2779367 RepID=UPI0018E7FCB2|nr:hypothetical protein [Paracoccus sp. IB05]MBJ2149755.1 hypothetical protein [Paracoccus sp. IB05]